MSDIAPVGRPGVAPTTRTGRPKLATASAGDAPSRGGDKVELSQAAKLLSRQAKTPEVRQQLVERVKSEIAKGTYDSDAKFDTAVEKMIDALQG